MTQVEQLQRQIEGMKVKIEEFKRFRSRYQSMLECNGMLENHMVDLRRSNRKLVKALDEIANADPEFRRRHIKDFATKVLTGLGYYMEE